MKVIFLDIDGVLNSVRSFAAFNHHEFRNPPKLTDSDLAYFYKITKKTLDPVAVALINRVCRDTGAKIVLSSTHRKHFSVRENGVIESFCLSDISIYLKALGLIGEFIDATPITNKDRGHEIKMWLNAHPEVTHYAIIDDDSDMLEEQLPNFVHTSGHDGMSFQNFQELVAILNKS